MKISVEYLDGTSEVFKESGMVNEVEVEGIGENAVSISWLDEAGEDENLSDIEREIVFNTRAIKRIDIHN